MKKKGASGLMLVMVIAVIAACAGVVLYLGGYITPAAAPPAGTQTMEITCQDDGTNSLFSAVNNPLNTSLHYEGQTLYVTTDSGEIVASGTATAGAALSFTEVSVPCTEDTISGKLYAVGSNTFTSADGVFAFGTKTSDNVILSGPAAGSLKMVGMDSTYTNTSDTSTVEGGGAGCTETETGTGAVTTVEASGSVARFIDFKQATAYKQYGSTVSGKPGILIGIDNANASSWNAGDIKISSISGGGNLASVSCDTYSNAKAALDLDECYTMDAIGSKDPTRRMKVEGTASGGNPYSDIVIYFVDLNWFQDVDGSIVYGGFNTGRTTQGQTTDCSYTIDIK